MTPKKAHLALPALMLSFIATVATAPAQTAEAPAAAPAETTQAPSVSVTVTGRVSNAATGFYLQNAEVRLVGTNAMIYTGPDGSYSITVPAGPVTLTASYTGIQTATRTINAVAGRPNLLDFDLQAYDLSARSGLGAGATEDVIQLEKFIVSEERTGQAKAIMDQRAADNAVTAINIENFGDLTSGSIGEFLKYMPGVTIDYDEDEATTVRVGGLDPKYSGFSMDGISLASGYGTSRANSFSQMSVTGIESIEFNQTLLARMPANTPAGKFELKTKYAFNRKKPEIKFQLGLDGNSNAIELGRDYMPDDKKHLRTYPGGQISYGGAFFKRRLGIEASISSYANYRNNQSHETKYSYLNPYHEKNTGFNFVRRNGVLEMEEGPVIQGLVWRDGPKIWSQQAASLNVDYKITPDLTFALRSNMVITENEYYNSYYELRAYEYNDTTESYTGPSNGVHPESTLTKWIVDPLAPGGTLARDTIFLPNSYFRNVRDTNYLISPRLAYKKGSLEINFRGAYSYSRRTYKDGEEGFFRTVTNRMQGMGWIAERSSSNSAEWYITQTAGTDWTAPQNYDRTDTYLHGTGLQPGKSQNKQGSAFLDFTYALPVFGHPVTLRSGIGYVNSDYYYKVEDNRYTYIGPEGRQRGVALPYTENYLVNLDMGGKAGNINEQGWRVNNLFALYDSFVEYPEWFTIDEINNAKRNFTNVRDLDERVESAYVEATTRAGRFSFNLGFRAERTKTEIMSTRMRTWLEIDEAAKNATPDEIASEKYVYTTNNEGVSTMKTLEGFYYQYHDGVRFPRIKDYTNFFFSGGIKYDFSKNLRFQLSASQAILRPDYDDLASAVSYSPYYRTNLWVPNPLLKPEKTLKMYAGLQYYFNPAGYFSISTYRIDIDQMQVRNKVIPREQAEAQIGYPFQSGGGSGTGEGEDPGGEEGDGDGDGDGGGATGKTETIFRSTINAKGTRTVYGMTLEYNQQLTFLPGYLKGVSVFGSFTTATLTNAQDDSEKIGQAKTSATGGIKYRYGRFNVQLRGVWRADRLVAVAEPIDSRTWMQHDHRYEKARLTIDLSGGFRLNKNLELAFSVRNITDSPSIWYSNVPDRLTRYQTYGSIWNVSLKGTY